MLCYLVICSVFLILRAAGGCRPQQACATVLWCAVGAKIQWMSTQHIQKDSSLTPAYVCYDFGGSEAESRQTEALLASPGPLAHGSDHDGCPELYLPSHHLPIGGQCPQRRVTGYGGLALANQHAPKSERSPTRNWAEPSRTKYARLTGRSLAALYMFSALYAPGRKNDRIQRRARRDEGRGRPRLRPFETSALTLFWKVYILFSLVSDDGQTFFFFPF